MNPLLIQAGVTGAIEVAKLAMEFIDKLNNNPDMTQEEFNAEWAKVQARVVSAENAWKAAGQPS
jgi:hypothetical protein